MLNWNNQQRVYPQWQAGQMVTANPVAAKPWTNRGPVSGGTPPVTITPTRTLLGAGV